MFNYFPTHTLKNVESAGRDKESVDAMKKASLAGDAGADGGRWFPGNEEIMRLAILDEAE